MMAPMLPFNWRQALIGILATVIISGITAIAGWSWALDNRVQHVEENVVVLESQLGKIELYGAPMDREARARIEALHDSIDNVSKQLTALARDQQDMLRYLIKGGK